MERYNEEELKESKVGIAKFKGVEKEISFGPICGLGDLPMEVTRFGITNPDPEYRIKRWPSQVFVIEYIISGSGYIEINGKKHRLSANDAYIIHPGDYCEYYADKDNPYKKYWVNFVSKMHLSDFLNVYQINDRIIRNIDLSEYFDQIFALEKISNLSENLYLHFGKIVYDIFYTIAIHNQKIVDSKSFDLAVMVRNELKNNVQSHITVNDIAKKFYRSKNDIISQFKKRYNTTPYAFLIELRILLAKHLLMGTDKSIAKIANELCFYSEFHFSNCFKKKVGESPSEFRKKHLEMQHN